MKILFIGPYRQDDGWGNASKQYLRSLSMLDDVDGFDIYSRPLYANYQKEFTESDEFEHLESKRSESFDVIIQNGLPHSFRKIGDAYNIGLAFFESTVNNSPWLSGMRLMDEMWVSSHNESKILNDAQIKNIVMPLPCNINKFDNLEWNSLLENHKHEYKFYFIGENTTRKNIKDIVKAFHLAFNRQDQVRLVLKVNNVGRPQEETLAEATTMCNQIKDSLGKYANPRDYKSEIIITEFLSEEDLLGIHKDCDCFVVSSYGEGFCMPAFDAMLSGNPVITNSGISVTDYIDHNKNGFIVSSSPEQAVAKDRPMKFLYNSIESWRKIDLSDLVKQMRSAYNLRMHPTDTQDIVEEYSQENVSGLMREYFGEIYDK